MSNLPTFARNTEQERIADMARREQQAEASEKAIRQEIKAREQHDEIVRMMRDICHHLRLPFWYHRITRFGTQPIYKLSEDWEMMVWNYRGLPLAKPDDPRRHLIVDFYYHGTSPSHRFSHAFEDINQTVNSSEELRGKWLSCIEALSRMEESRKARDAEEAGFNAVWNELADTYPDDFAPADEPEYPFDPATEIVETVDLGIEITHEGFLLQRELCIYADGHEDPREYYLEYTCWDGVLPY